MWVGRDYIVTKETSSYQIRDNFEVNFFLK